MWKLFKRNKPTKANSIAEAALPVIWMCEHCRRWRFIDDDCGCEWNCKIEDCEICEEEEVCQARS